MLHMSHLRCLCGNDIYDNTDNLPHKAEFYAHQDFDIWSKMPVLIADFLRASLRGERNTWIRNYFLPGYPLELDDEAVIQDAMTSVTDRCRRTMYECTKCGRLWLPLSPDESKFTSFVPENAGYQGLLKGTLSFDQSGGQSAPASA